MHFFARHRENIRQSSMSSRLLWPCLLLAALLLWNTAGRPEPAEAPAFKDVADPDTAKAAQWCVEHGLMDQKLGGRFAPDNSDPAYKTLNAYQQLVG